MDSVLQAILQDLEKTFAAKGSEFRGQASLLVPADQIVAAAQALRDQHGFGMLAALSAVDYWPQPQPRFHVVYQFKNIPQKLRLELRVALDGNEPELDSISSIYPNANWHERELWDMFGLRIKNHPDLRRILMPEDWAGYPLRKDYPLGYEEVEFTFNFEEIEQRKPRPKE
ncbi:MAG TPA: NADH-quinone oxidoreductase subunit C [Anaerolineales bacterium]|nr:NADH-quinone oxidoreductase subunit C [Anaerolineales bacterium]HLE73027.1 NADH-quinone oxidoreductase subunit C [Anaerolineales bacterium]